MRLGGRVAEHGDPLCPHRRQHHVLGGGDGGFVEEDVGAAQAGRGQTQLAVLVTVFRPQRGEAQDVGVHAPSPDAVAARVAELRAAFPRQQRAHEHQRPAYLPEQLGVGAGAAEDAGAQGRGVAIGPRDLHPQALHHREQGAHVVDVGEIAERDGLGGEQTLPLVRVRPSITNSATG